MKKSRYFLLVLALVIGGSLFAQSQRELAQLMRDRDEYYFTLSVADRSEVQTINSLCSVDGFDGSNVVCYANQQQYAKLLQAGYQPNLQTPPSLREEAKMWDGSDRATYEWDSYPTYSAYETMMQGFPTSTVSGRTCTLLTLGTLSSGRKIMGVRINNGTTTGKPKFMYSSTIHGDETTGWILMLRLIDELCTSTDSRIVNLVNNLDIFIFPNTNPDGTYYGGNNTVTGARRYNANSVDMNRNYPDPHSNAHPDGNAYQTETQWFMTLAETYPFTMAANYHGGAEIVNYPWDNTSTRHADDAWWQYVSSEYADLCHVVSSSYLTTANSQGDKPSGITNGADWYTIGGGRQDYMNGYRQCREVTVECSNTKNPSASQLPTFWNYNHNSILALLEQCLKGVHGFVYDATTNQPIDGVTITVLNHDDQYSIVSTHEDGDFHRPIKGGTWTLEVTKTGYQSQQVTVSVADGQCQDIEVYLTPEGGGGGDDPITPATTNCYEQVTPSAAGDYVMGYLDGTTLTMPIHNNGTASTVSAQVNLTDNGFSVEQESAPGMVTLTSTGTANQYYIAYDGRYITRSSGGYSSGAKAITWSTTQGNNNKWTITANGITQTSTTRTYYLYYNNNGFYTSTTNTNNIKFYEATNCPTPTYAITATANPAEGGSVTGAGTYDEGQTCTLTATASEGYVFVNWTKEGTEVSTQATYSFIVTEEGDYVANFAEIPPASPNEAWVPNTDFTGEGMAVVAQIKIDGELLDRGTWELGAFCNDECRACVFPLTSFTENNLGYFAYMNIVGNDDDEISFRLYDAVSGTVLEAMCNTTVELENGGTVGVDVFGRSIFVLNFKTVHTFTKEILAYNSDPNVRDHYYLIATPVGEVAPDNVGSMLDNEYDLYYFDQAINGGFKEWINYEGPDGNYNLVSGKGYLYANSEDVTLTFTGLPYVGSGEVTLTKDDDVRFSGWNLVGNPFAETAYIGNRAFYRMNEEGNEIEAATDAAIAPMEGIFVIANEDGETLTFSTEERQSGKGAMLVLSILRTRGTAIDRAIIRFDNGSELPKFQLNTNTTKVYIPQNHMNFAVVNAGENGEMPVNFKAAANGTYTIRVSKQEVDFRYLHLIDNITGADIDLLATPSYTFEANAANMEYRFKLVFVCGEANDDSDFAFFSNGSWIVDNEGPAILQVVDVQGRILSSEQIEGCVSKQINTVPGIYMLRLVKGEDVRVQKVVVR